VAVIAPPFFTLDERALAVHFEAAAAACAPLPFYVYEFAARSGYAVPLTVVERLRETAPNLRGLKVSDKPWERLEPYLLDGLDVFVGAEGLVARGLAAGAAGAVSGLAAVYPEVVAALLRERTAERSAEAERLRGALDGLPFHAAAKTVVARRGVPMRDDVRAPLRKLTEDERRELELP
jgi:4-hydroxy-tetrahydrodipicolinate synthase